jgi:hypothetical protein
MGENRSEKSRVEAVEWRFTVRDSVFGLQITTKGQTPTGNRLIEGRPLLKPGSGARRAAWTQQLARMGCRAAVPDKCIGDKI